MLRRIRLRRALLLVLLPVPPALSAQEAPAAPLPKISAVPYGSLRATLGAGEGGNMEIVNKLSRLGVSLEAPLWGDFSAFGKYEAGINLVDQNPTLDFSGGDDNPAAGKGSQAVTTRLGYLGFKGAFGTVAIGKQWSVYYDVSEWTDRFNQIGGQASGTYNADTDGGISGTGRPENALIYRPPTWGPLEFGLQVQLRNRSTGDVPGADTYGASLRWTVTKLLSVGLAGNVVRDGVANPGPLEPKAGDRSAILGLKLQDGDDWTLALTGGKSKAHEFDNAGTWFDSAWSELYGSYRFRPSWTAYAGYNDLRPSGGDYRGQYRKSYAAGGVQWTLPLQGGKSFCFLEAKLDHGQSDQGVATHGTAVGFGLRLTF